jgi:hypothetical protein
LDFFLGRDGVDLRGLPYPGHWLNRRSKTRLAATALRYEAVQFFYELECRDDLVFWFTVAGLPMPRTNEIGAWLEQCIARRHPKGSFTL